MATYSFIENAGGPERKVSQIQLPLKISVDHPKWAELDIYLDEYAKKSREKAYFPPFREYSENLISGAANLVNFLIKEQRNSRPVDTLLFLDKSARNAAYIFNLVWFKTTDLLIAEGMNKAELVKPNIRFIDAKGSYQLDMSTPFLGQLLLGQFYKKEDFSGRVLVVDESIFTGNSARTTIDLLKSSGYSPKTIEVLGNYQAFPGWYAFDSVKGIASVDKVSPKTIDFVKQLPKAEALLLAQKMNTVHLPEIMKSARLHQVPLVGKMILNLLGKPEANQIFELAAANQIDVEELFYYFKSIGGNIGLAPQIKDREETRRYRQVLSEMVTESFERNLISVT